MITRREMALKKDWTFRRGDIYLANLNPYRGSVQGGTRPVLVLQNDDGNYFCDTLIIAPFSTLLKKRDLPTHCFIRWSHALNSASVVMLEQINTIPKDRIRGYLGRLTKEQMEKVEDCIRDSLGLEIPECLEAP